MNKTVFIMDSIGNAVQWAAGMSLRVCLPNQVEVRRETGATVISWVGVDPRKCVLKFVQALCLSPDGSLLTWDEDEQEVVCGGWRKDSEDVETCNPKEPNPDRLPDGRPIIRVEGHPQWRELYDDEMILPDDRVSARESFDFSVLAEASSWSGKHLRSYRLAGDENQVPYGKAYRRIKPKKQKAEEAQS